MGMITVPGLGQVPIKGDRPDDDEQRGIIAALETKRAETSRQEGRRTDQEITDWSNTPVPQTPAGPRETLRPRGAEVLEATGQPLPTAPGAPPTRRLEYPDAPTTGHLALPGMSLPWNKGKDIEGNQGVPVGDKAALLFGTLSTSSPKARQEIYVKNLPGAEAHDDKYGNPMIRYQGKLYYTARPGEIDAMDVGRTVAGVAGTLPVIAAAPASVPGLLAVGGLTAAGQSVAEDVVAKVSGADSLPWVDVEKALWSGAFGMALPAILKGSPIIAGKLNELIKRGEPLTDDALRVAGLTDVQISSLTPEMRQNISTVAHRTFNDKGAMGATYRGDLAEQFMPGGPGLTRGELSGDPTQIAREQTLAVPSDTPGRARASAIIQGKRAEQDVGLNAAQQELRVKAGGRPGQPPMTPEEASSVLQGRRDVAYDLAEKNRDALYGKARDPLAVEAAGGSVAVPATHASQIGKTTRAALAADDVGRIALGDSAKNLTPNAKEALAAVDRFSQRSVGPRVPIPEAGGQSGTVYTPEGLLAKDTPPGATSTRFALDQPGTVTKLPDVDWKTAENLRQELVRYRNKAAAEARVSGNQQDVAVMEQIVQNFDDHFGPLNPLYAPARKAHEELKSVFTAKGSIDHDAATKAVLGVMEGPEGGATIVNTIFGSKFSKNEAGQMLDHLNTRVFAEHPEAQNAIKEMALRRLTENADGKVLTPQQTVTAIEKAFGDREGSLYGKLFTQDELHELRRFQELQRVLAESRTKINPNPSGLIVQAVMQAKSAANIGTVVGTTIGTGAGSLLSPLGAGIGGAVGGAIGRVGGSAIDATLPGYRATQAVRPPPGYGQSGASSRVPSLLGLAATPTARDEVPGPADKIIDGLLMGGR